MWLNIVKEKAAIHGIGVGIVQNGQLPIMILVIQGLLMIYVTNVKQKKKMENVNKE